jgi:hypothetical protein
MSWLNMKVPYFSSGFLCVEAQSTPRDKGKEEALLQAIEKK